MDESKNIVAYTPQVFEVSSFCFFLYIIGYKTTIIAAVKGIIHLGI